MADKKRAPRVQRGKRTKLSISSVHQGYEMRSLLEVHFAQELDRRGITWRYEPERIGAGHYLVDFYLPDLGCWVEVKGRYEPRDSLLLPNVAINLKRDRGERLFLYMERKAYRIDARSFIELTHDDFWAALQPPPASESSQGEQAP